MVKLPKICPKCAGTEGTVKWDKDVEQLRSYCWTCSHKFTNHIKDVQVPTYLPKPNKPDKDIITCRAKFWTSVYLEKLNMVDDPERHADKSLEEFDKRFGI